MADGLRENLNGVFTPPQFNWQVAIGANTCVVQPGEKGRLIVYQPDGTAIRYDGVIWWKYEGTILTCYLDPDQDGFARSMVTTPLPWIIQLERKDSPSATLSS